MRYASDVHVGRVNPKNAKFNLKVDNKALDLVAIILQLQQTAEPGPYLARLDPPYAHYRALLAALATTRADTADPQRARHVRQIELTLERWRWLPDSLGERFILVNVPAFQLYAFDLSVSRDTPQVHMPVVVGKAARTQTPIFSGQLRYLYFRPYWNVPPGILRNEILPKLRRDPGYLTRANLELVSAGAPEGPARTYPPTAANLNRLAAGALRVRQKPGPKNSLGLVKFMFPNPYNVYLHDTPEQALFEKERRDFSHGCIRIANPPRLAQFVLHDQPQWTPAAIDSAMRVGRNARQVFVTNPLPVYILYGTVFAAPDGTIRFYDDVYKLDAALERALAAARGQRGLPSAREP
jgi:murein L,D-transpeptidase YcbB/YkuD